MGDITINVDQAKLIENICLRYALLHGLDDNEQSACRELEVKIIETGTVKDRAHGSYCPKCDYKAGINRIAHWCPDCEDPRQILYPDWRKKNE